MRELSDGELKYLAKLRGFRRNVCTSAPRKLWPGREIRGSFRLLAKVSEKGKKYRNNLEFSEKELQILLALISYSNDRKAAGYPTSIF